MTNEFYTGQPKSPEQEAREYLERLVNAETLPALTQSFGVEMPDDLDAVSRLEWLKTFGEEHLNVRRGKTRQNTADVKLTDEQEAAIMATADELHMQGNSYPNRTDFDFITIPGGANQSPLLRVRYAKEQMDAGVQAPYLILLGSSRVLDKEKGEPENTADYAPGAKTEFDLMNAAIEHEFGVDPEGEETLNLKNFSAKIMSEEDSDFWKVRYYVAPNGTHILSVCAPLRDGHDAANTTDTYRFMNEVVGPEMLADSNVLNVTTDLFTAFQHFDALNLLTLPHGANVQTIGYGGTKRAASQYGQEINSAFRRGSRLQQSLLAA